MKNLAIRSFNQLNPLIRQLPRALDLTVGETACVQEGNKIYSFTVIDGKPPTKLKLWAIDHLTIYEEGSAPIILKIA